MIVTDYICKLWTNKIRFRFYNEVKWNLTQLTTRRAVTCCQSAVCLFVWPLDHSLTPIPPPLLFLL